MIPQEYESLDGSFPDAPDARRSLEQLYHTNPVLPILVFRRMWAARIGWKV